VTDAPDGDRITPAPERRVRERPAAPPAGDVAPLPPEDGPDATAPTAARDAEVPPPTDASALSAPATTVDVESAAGATPLPGAHRGGFQRLPTAPVDTTASAATPFEPSTWPEHPEPAPPRGLAGTALAFAITGVFVAFFVGWGFPVGVAAVVIAIVALRRPVESRVVAGWALALGILSVLYSAGWLLFAATR
jgi:hypothetical protein